MNKALLSTHRVWFLCLLCALALLVAAPIVGASWRDGLEITKAAQIERIAHLTTQIQQWEKDAAQARTLGEELAGEDFETYLAPMSRTALAAQLEPLAARMRLSKLVYTLGPEEKAKRDAAFPDMMDLSQSSLTIEAEAALDSDVFSFLEALSALPGRIDIEHLKIERTNERIGLRNLRLRTELVWYANTAQKEPVR